MKVFLALVTLPLAVFLPDIARSEVSDWMTSMEGCRLIENSLRSPDHDPHEQISWSGDCSKTLAQGHGRIVYYKNGKSTGDSAEGTFLDGVQVGDARITTKNGTVFNGHFREHKFYGQLSSVLPNGDRIIGQVDGDLSSMTGELTYLDGRHYKGSFRNYKFEGHGVLDWPNKFHYDGSFFEGNMTGYGIIKLQNGDIYQGQWKKNLPDGHGKFLQQTREVNGIWQGGCFNDGLSRVTFPLRKKPCG